MRTMVISNKCMRLLTHGPGLKDLPRQVLRAQTCRSVRGDLAAEVRPRAGGQAPEAEYGKAKFGRDGTHGGRVLIEVVHHGPPIDGG